MEHLSDLRSQLSNGRKVHSMYACVWVKRVLIIKMPNRSVISANSAGKIEIWDGKHPTNTGR